ncbi:hypothetical protein HU200_049781 [Digitaria exilis]|uniref:Myb-like domain-containing protein n=1 Tax=Digitaria exilis TaxID=1010633 RepID=A0A835AT71_9POAL|nr:hypothetical protein HU200_049781 [Digitaria exilis]
MDVLPPAPAPYFAGQAGGGRFLAAGGPGPGAWTQEENKLFERALARVDWDAPDRWERVAAFLPGRMVSDVVAHYGDLENDVCYIEAGLVPFPHYAAASQPAGFTFDWDGAADAAAALGFKRSPCYMGTGRNISRNFVTSRTPTQVASHAQKYFIRLNSGGKDKRRSSIHDITTVNLPDDDGGNPSASPPSVLTAVSTPSSTGGPVMSSEQFGVLVDSKPTQPHHHFMPHHHYGNVKLEPGNSHHGGFMDESVLMQMQCGQLQPLG